MSKKGTPGKNKESVGPMGSHPGEREEHIGEKEKGEPLLFPGKSKKCVP